MNQITINCEICGKEYNGNNKKETCDFSVSGLPHSFRRQDEEGYNVTATGRRIKDD
jgi:hypothetical protein